MAKEFAAPSAEELFKDFFDEAPDHHPDVIDVDSAETQMMIRQHIQKQQIDLTAFSDGDDDDDGNDNCNNNDDDEIKHEVIEMKQQNKAVVASQYQQLLELNDQKLSRILQNLTSIIGLVYIYIFVQHNKFEYKIFVLYVCDVKSIYIYIYIFRF